MLLQRKNDRREASSTSGMRYARAPSFTLAGSASMRNRKSGLTSSRSSADPDAGVEGAVGAAALVEAEQRLHVVVRRGPAVRAPRERRQNLRRARRLFACRLGCAHEDAPAARRLLRHLAVVRSADEEQRDDHRRADVAVVVVTPDRDAIGPEPSGFAASDFTRGDGHLVEAGFQRDAHLEPVVGREQRIARVRCPSDGDAGSCAELGRRA